MILAEIGLVTTVAYAMLAVLVVAVMLAFTRLVLGPSLPDRVIALDLTATLLVGVIAVYAIATDQSIVLRVAMVVALINFIGTIAFAYYLQLRNEE